MALPRPLIRHVLSLMAWCVPSRLPRIIANISDYLRWCIHARGFQAVGINSYLRRPHSIYNPEYVRLGDCVMAEPGLVLEAFDEFYGQDFNPHIVIGDRVSLGYHCHIGCVREVLIGDDTLIASRVFISDHSHGDQSELHLEISPVMRPLISRGPVRIGARVWVGEGVCILPGVTIGDNSVIGANSVVTHDVPPNSVYAGVPARLISSRK
jgi:acetyltransferase-like isoleucine patch superfamily enzyme